MHCRLRRRRLLRGQTIHGLLHHGGYWCLPHRRRWCAQTYLMSSFCTRIKHARYSSMIVG
jgi:hypothetical protein